jgi:hypothetical protein
VDKKYIQEILNSPSALLLILSNLLVLVTVFFSNLSIVHLLLIYWLEVFVITFFALFKIVIYKILFKYKRFSFTSILISIIFICGWYFLYLPFIFVMLVPLGDAVPYENLFGALFPSLSIFAGFITSFLILFISHLISLLNHFKENPDVEEKKAGGQIMGRLFVFHFCIIIGIGIGIFLGGVIQGVLIIFILMKTIIDLNSHLNYHK